MILETFSGLKHENDLKPYSSKNGLTVFATV
jgi:hypothetical protein